MLRGACLGAFLILFAPLMLFFLRRALRSFGVDRAIGYSLVGQIWAMLSGPVSVFFLSVFLSPVEQGFYYTFSGILGLLIFLELGLGLVLLQFASHEKADLEWTSTGTLEGSDSAKARLSSLLRRVLLWYGVLAVLSVVLLLPIGLWFFSRDPANAVKVAWQGPWAWVVLISGFNLLITPVLAVLEGCGLVAQITALRTVQKVVSSVATWACLALGFRLYSVVALNLALVLVGGVWLWREKRVALLDLLAPPAHPAHIDWRGEVWPLQWRVALSCISSYFIFVFFNPVLFSFHGAVAAGQMGMTLTIVNALSGGPMAWVGTKLAPFGTLIAKRQWRELDKLFFPAMWQSLGLMAVLQALFFVAACVLHFTGHSWSMRLLPLLPMGLLIVATLLSAIVGLQALYLRAHKQEPYFLLSVIGAALIAPSTYFLGRSFAALGMTAGYLAVNILLCCLGTWIFIQKRREWHLDMPTEDNDAPAQASSTLEERTGIGKA